MPSIFLSEFITGVIFLVSSTFTCSVSGKGFVISGTSISFFNSTHDFSFDINVTFLTCSIPLIFSIVAFMFASGFKYALTSRAEPKDEAKELSARVTLKIEPKIVKMAAIVVIIAKLTMPA